MAAIDGEWIDRMRSEVDGAAEALVARHCLRARVTARCQVEHEAVEAVLQQAFAAAWGRLDELRSGTEFPRWFLGVLRQILSGYVGTHPESVRQPPPRRPEPDPDGERERAFLGLPVEDRELLALHGDADLGYDDLAELWDCSRPQLERRLLAVRRRFREAIAQEAAGLTA
jgi:DNA-directed RNA polymerase specialized sigma24 family protein